MTGGRAGWWLAAILIGQFCWESCKVVKEDRRSCPCTLSVVMNALPEYPARLYVNGKLAGEAAGDTTLQVWVSQGPVAQVSALCGGLPLEEGAVHIPYGEACPALYSFYGVADCSGETARMEVKMQKQFCTLSLLFDGPPGWGEPYWAELRGCVSGFRLQDESPLQGDFRCRMDGDFRARLPRQGPEDMLWLDIVMTDGVLRSFPLDSYLRKASYDWKAQELSDIALEVRLSISEISFALDLWNQTIPLEIEI